MARSNKLIHRKLSAIKVTVAQLFVIKKNPNGQNKILEYSSIFEIGVYTRIFRNWTICRD